MKLKTMIIAVLCFLAGAANSTSLSDPMVTIVRKDSSSTYLLNYSSSVASRVTITIKDEKGVAVVTKSIKSIQYFSLPVNFSILAFIPYR